MITKKMMPKKCFPIFFIIFTVSVLLFAGMAMASNTYYVVNTWGSAGSGNGQLNIQYGGVAVDSSGNVYVADDANFRIEKFDSKGNYLAQWGSYGSGSGQFNHPFGVAADSAGNIYVADTYNNRIEKFDSNGNYLSQFGNGQLNWPYCVAVDGSGNVYVTEGMYASASLIVKFDSNGNYVTQFGSYGTGNGQTVDPWGVAVDSSGNVYVADLGNNRIEKFDPNGNYLAQFGNGQFNDPRGVAADSSGNIYVADNRNSRIVKFDSNGNYLTQFGNLSYMGVAADSSGHVYADANSTDNVQKFVLAGTLTATVLYNGQPLQNAYLYLQNGARPPLEEQYLETASYILGPSDANGNISVNVIPGVYYVRITKKTSSSGGGLAGYCGSYPCGPPYPGDYTWKHIGNPPTVTITSNSVVDLGTVNTTIYGQSITISGTVKGASGKPLAGWAVKATTAPCESGNWGYAHSFNECGSVVYPAWTDANGNYSINIGNSGTYYVYASPNLNFANTNYPGGYPTCATGVGCEDCGDYFYYNCPVNVTSSVSGENIAVPGY
ncbi:MAG: hypothetical protein M0033_04365 [Nitrospiraceae bacterium]|nr:hypothetical protein [Nitrospiraceae bacterium]